MPLRCENEELVHTFEEINYFIFVVELIIKFLRELIFVDLPKNHKISGNLCQKLICYTFIMFDRATFKEKIFCA